MTTKTENQKSATASINGKTNVRWIAAASKNETAGMGTAALREHYLAAGLVQPGSINMVYWEVERALAGMVVPTVAPLQLSCKEHLKSEYFCQRRELGVVNLGKPGKVVIDGTEHVVKTHDFLYIGMGTRSVEFASDDAASPAIFYCVSYPAHRSAPCLHVPAEGRESRSLGDEVSCNQRELDAVITPDRAHSCQLVMGMTKLKERSVWNTMPPHTHARRSEVYCYFSLSDDALVFHLMGPPSETRHLVVRDLEVVLSPNWSIHSGVGTSNYGFVWAMGGENQAFDDMDMVAMPELK